MIIPWLYNDYTMIIPWLYHHYTMIIPWLYHVYTMIIPSLYHHYTMIIPWLYHHYTMIIPWLYHDYTIIIPSLYHHYTMIIPSLNHDYTIIEPFLPLIIPFNDSHSLCQAHFQVPWVEPPFAKATPGHPGCHPRRLGNPQGNPRRSWENRRNLWENLEKYSEHPPKQWNNWWGNQQKSSGNGWIIHGHGWLPGSR